MINPMNGTIISPRDTGCISLGGPVKEIIQPVEVPVAAFPLRGRCNPYFKYLIPLIILRFLTLLALLGALISAVIIPRVLENFNQETNQETQDTRVAAVVLFAISISVILTLLVLEILNLFNIADSKFVSILISLLDLLLAIMVLGISIPLIVRESILETTPVLYLNAVDFGTFRASGILGMIAVFFLLIHLFFSRFYQFCIGNYKSFKREFLTCSLPYSTTTTTCQQIYPSGLNRIGHI